MTILNVARLRRNYPYPTTDESFIVRGIVAQEAVVASLSATNWPT